MRFRLINVTVMINVLSDGLADSAQLIEITMQLGGEP